MPEEDFDEPGASTRPFWSGTISFGLVSIPVNLFPANRGERVSLRTLGPRGKPLARRYYSEKTGTDLDSQDIVRGYETKKNRFVEITDEELDRLAPDRSREISLRRFVEDKSISRVYFERGYFLAPNGPTRAYHLLAETMERTGRVGIATFVMRGKEYLVCITSENGILRAETMRFPDEIRSPDAVGLPKPMKVPPAAVRSFETFITNKSRPNVSAKDLKDEDAESLRKLIDRKRKSKKNVIGAPGRGKRKAEVVDLLEVLQRSLAQGGRRSQSAR